MTIPARLRAAAFPIVPGSDRLYVRAAAGLRIIGIAESNRTKWEQWGYLEPVRVNVPVSRDAAHGVACYYPLDQLLAAHRRRQTRSRRPWTEREAAALVAAVGAKSIEQIARSIHRTPEGCQRKLTELGVDWRRVVIERDGL